MNLLEAKNKALMLIDAYSKNGIVQDPDGTKLKNYTLKMAPFFDMAQKQTATIKKICKAKNISHNMPVNALSNSDYMHDIVAFVGTDQSYEVIGAKAYCFEVDDAATIYIEEEISGVWTTLYTITNTSTLAGTYTAYRGIITASSDTNTIRIRFSGTTTYNHRNRALFTVSFSGVTRVPYYRKYVLYTMPTDFYQFNKLILKGQVVNSQGYQNSSDFYWEQKNILALRYDLVAEFSAEYFAYPTTIDSTTLDTYEFEVDTEAQEILPLYVASQLLLSENNAVGDRLLSQYQNALANLDTKVAVSSGSVSNSLFNSMQGSKKLF